MTIAKYAFNDGNTAARNNTNMYLSPEWVYWEGQVSDAARQEEDGEISSVGGPPPGIEVDAGATYASVGTSPGVAAL